MPNVDADFDPRLKAQVEVRAAICEQWLPLWRTLLRYKSQSEKLAVRIVRIRAATMAQLALVYGPELSMLPEPERAQLLISLDLLTGFESWAGCAKTTASQAAHELWATSIGRLLPPPPFGASPCRDSSPGLRADDLRTGGHLSGVPYVTNRLGPAAHTPPASRSDRNNLAAACIVRPVTTR
ncbi:hypothetical protein [Reyranella soli]|uniref:Uncharacterized protein n=1 Tax=Reyranella soli TaxID=1230389 RepID=A0A512NJG1_9HYPH|nr:hypothetical protein [Reyranella soli]GEP59052.1 hypothetical protein RSO01_62180 [Reyranella soli]